MPSFHFKIYDRATPPNQHSLELADEATAIAEARKAARELVEAGGYLFEATDRIEVRSDEGTLLAVIPLQP